MTITAVPIRAIATATMGLASLFGSFSPGASLSLVISEVPVTEDSESVFPEVDTEASKEELDEDELSSGGVMGGGVSATPMEERSASARAERK